MRILFINLPPYVAKKPRNDLFFAQRSLNLGLLAVASSARRDGHDVLLYDWAGPAQANLLGDLGALADDFQPAVVGFSVPSGYAEEYLLHFAQCIRAHLPDATIVVGGQYHAGARGEALLAKFPEIDHVVAGLGDGLDWNALVHSRGDRTRTILRVAQGPGTTRSIPTFDWTVHGYDLRGYAPKIEIARGCPFKCSFCAISGAPERLSRTGIDAIHRQLEFWLSLWTSRAKIPLYVECPIFFCSRASITDYEACFSECRDRFLWRAAARVDSIDLRVLERLRSLGMAVLDIGLETGSPEMLKLMNKTNKPIDYLRRAKLLIATASSVGIKVKLNILLYAGETPATVLATQEFIDECSSHISGVSVGSLIDYPGTVLRDELPYFTRRFGTKRVQDPLLSAADIFPLHLSNSIDYEHAQTLCIRISQSVMSAEKYYALKSIGYYPPGFTYANFREHVSRTQDPVLPFSVDQTISVRPHQPPGEFLPRWDVLR